MAEREKETITAGVLLKEETISGLEKAISDFQDKKIGVFGLFAAAFNVWGKANENETLKAKIEERMGGMRLTLHQMAPLDISKHGDPIKQRYNPSYWLGDKRKGFKDEEEIEEFILERTITLKEFFENL